MRRRVQTAAFMGMNANSTGTALDLFEIRDIHEEGISFQSPQPMEPGESFSLSLDLTEPATYIHTSGRVVWSEPSGRTGLRFHRMPTADLDRLRAWLSGGAVDQASEDEGLSFELPSAPQEPGMSASLSVLVPEFASPPDPSPADVSEQLLAAPPVAEAILAGGLIEGDELIEEDEPLFALADVAVHRSEREAGVSASELEPEVIPLATTTPLVPSETCQRDAGTTEEDASAVAATDDVGREIEGFTLDLEAALQIVAERTLTLTGASGAAIALSTGEEMVCRASAGNDAPPLGARLQVGSGFSGECVHTGKLLYCEDSESDTRVDRESCRALGVRSIMATPIHAPREVVGLLEIFSPAPHAFVDRDRVTLERMAQIIYAAVQRTVHSMVIDHPEDRDSGYFGANGVSASGSELSANMDVGDDPADGDIFSGEGTTVPSAFWRKPKIPVIAGTVLVLLLAAAFLFLRPGDKTSAAMMQTQTNYAPATTKFQAQTASMDELRKLAQAGDADAQFQLGVRYAVGSDVAQDYSEAARWFSAAAEQGHILAQSNMGAYYWAGRGVEKDLNKAYFWALLAQSGGDDASRVRVPFLASRLSETEILADQNQANEWFKNHRSHSKPSPSK